MKILLVVFATAITILLILNLAGGEKRVRRKLPHHGAIEKEQLLREMSTMLGPTIVQGNRITALQNGDEIFPAMLSAIAAAQRTITFETYIYWSGEIGRQFAEALEARARAGVKVHVILDWAGSAKADASVLKQMEQSGVEVKRFHPLSWYHLARMNNRTHRKLLVVDGRIGFTGGVGIADVWSGAGQDPEHWRDSHYQFEGPVVAQAQAVFLDNWIKSTGAVLRGDGYFPELAPVGDTPAQLFASSPTGGSESMQLMTLMALASAERSIDLAAAYFVPDRLALDALLEARRRGVAVRIIVPGKHIDSKVVRWASKRSWGELLAAGAEIHEFGPTMFHCKGLIVDRWMVSVGSTNFDQRSFALNSEASLNVYDAGVGEALARAFERDLTLARRVTLEEWQRRPWTQRLREQLIRPFESQL
ncbi:MAG: cardiolipin synthase B [Cytophagaceae bacterium]|nr:cardiolipin synthase B [Gemmatimonadaceae bacterium]